jgi:hypothetical protein
MWGSIVFVGLGAPSLRALEGGSVLLCRKITRLPPHDPEGVPPPPFVQASDVKIRISVGCTSNCHMYIQQFDVHVTHGFRGFVSKSSNASSPLGVIR